MSRGIIINYEKEEMETRMKEVEKIEEFEAVKIKTFRQSGLPVDLDQLEQFDKEFKAAYDKIYNEHGKDMPKVEAALQKLDEELASKYDTVVEMDLLTEEDDIKNFLTKYGNYMTTTHRDTGELLYVILDQGM